jgi:hypothetical protein
VKYQEMMSRAGPARGRPVTEELGDDGERRGRDRAGVRQPLDTRAVGDLRTPTDGVGHVQHLVPVPQGLDACEREADLRVKPADDQSLATCCRHCLAKGGVLERVHRRPVDRLDAGELGPLVYGIDAAQITAGDCVAVLSDPARTADIVSCFSLLHHFVMGRGTSGALREVRPDVVRL